MFIPDHSRPFNSQFGSQAETHNSHHVGLPIDGTALGAVAAPASDPIQFAGANSSPVTKLATRLGEESVVSNSSRKLRVLDLFSGIGGFSLGLERTGGFETVAFCEIEPFCRRVLAKHWPQVKQYEDVRTLTADALERDGIAVDVICGGFPCQDISIAGKGAGIEGERSGLWTEYARIIGELRPSYVIVENVAALLGRGLDRVLGDLAEIGFDAEWHCIPASAVGAPHRRDRLWIVAYPNSQPIRDEGRGEASGAQRKGQGPAEERKRIWPDIAASSGGQDVADAYGPRLEGWLLDWESAKERLAGEGGRAIPGEWLPEPDVGRVAHGVPARVDRLRALGNAVVPQIPELIGRAVLASMQEAAQ